MRYDQIALQLFTVRRLAAVDLPGTLRAVAEAGFRSVELAGLPATEPVELARLIDEAGLHAIASHEPIERLREDPLAVAERLAAIGCPRLVVPWMPEADRGTVADVRRFAAEVGALARAFAGRGIRLGYHNHDYEFAPLEGTTAWDVLLGELPSEVEIELDVYWASVAGRDPVMEIRRAADRLRLLHLKDHGPGQAPQDLPPGEGILDIPAIVDAGRDAGVEWYIAEQVDAPDPLAAITSARRYLGSLAR